MKIRLASPCNIDSIVDGPGLRIVVWTQGCPHHCPFCHNPQTHSYTGGFEEDVQTIIDLFDNRLKLVFLTFLLCLSTGFRFLELIIYIFAPV